MHFSGRDLNIVEAGSAHFFRDPNRGLLDIRLMFAFGTDTRYTQELLELIEVLIALGLDVINQFHSVLLGVVSTGGMLPAQFLTALGTTTSYGRARLCNRRIDN